MFFYDPKTQKHFCMTDEEKHHFVCWAEKGIINHVRLIKTAKIRELFDSLPTCYSKIIYDPDTGQPWVQYEGGSGNTCYDLRLFIKEFNMDDGEEYVITYKRFARDNTTFSLPKEMAISEYVTLKGFNLSKAMASVQRKEIVESEGPEKEQCMQYLGRLLM